MSTFWLIAMPLTGLTTYLEHSHNDPVVKFVLMKYGAFALALYGFVVGTFLVRLRSPTLAYLGTISFSLYLFHPPIAHLLLMAHAEWTPELRLTSTTFTGATIACTIAFAALVYRYVEAPAIALGARICRRLEPYKETMLKV